jgi:hypothetical protein
MYCDSLKLLLRHPWAARERGASHAHSIILKSVLKKLPHPYMIKDVTAWVTSLFYKLFREEVVRLEGYLRDGVPPTCPTLSSRGRERHQRRRFHAKRTRAKRDSPDTCLALAQVSAYSIEVKYDSNILMTG